MVICAVVSCKNNPDNTVGVSFHRFPNAQKKKDLYSKWIHAVNRVNPVSTSSTIDKLWTPNYHSVVCSEHFTPDSFTKNPCIVDSMNLTGFRVRLKPDAYPSLLLGQRAAIQCIKPAFKKRETQRVLAEACSEYIIRHQRENLNTPPPEPDSDDDTHEENTEALTVGEKKDASMQTDIKKVLVKRTQTDEIVMKPIQRSIGTMTDFCEKPTLKSSATMTDDVAQKSVETMTDVAGVNIRCHDEDQEDSDSDDSTEDEDEDWLPPVDESDDDCEDTIGELDITDHQEDVVHRERKYIVYESCLKELLSSCRSCHEQCRVIIKSRLGTFVRMLSSCEACGMEYSWGSQPLTSRLPAGNLEVAGSILFTGASASKALQLFSNMNIMCISERTFRNIQCSYLIPAVRNVWMEYQTAALQLCEGRDVKVGGDARCCSPGHSAKYGSYSLMDLESGMILAVELVQVTETENSYRMEIEGLKRCLQNLKDRNIRITDLTTDRHVQVKSYMAKEETSIRTLVRCLACCQRYFQETSVAIKEERVRAD